jgi:hypothetical protein
MSAPSGALAMNELNSLPRQALTSFADAKRQAICGKPQQINSKAVGAIAIHEADGGGQVRIALFLEPVSGFSDNIQRLGFTDPGLPVDHPQGGLLKIRQTHRNLPEPLSGSSFLFEIECN